MGDIDIIILADHEESHRSRDRCDDLNSWVEKWIWDLSHMMIMFNQTNSHMYFLRVPNNEHLLLLGGFNCRLDRNILSFEICKTIRSHEEMRVIRPELNHDKKYVFVFQYCRKLSLDKHIKYHTNLQDHCDRISSYLVHVFWKCHNRDT